MKCYRCGQNKPKQDFAPYNKSWCRDCTRQYNRIYKRLHPEYFKCFNKRWRDKHKEQISQYYKEWYRRHGRKRNPNYADTIVLWQRQNPEKVGASDALRQAIRQGIVLKPTQCSNCGKANKLIAHHKDYSMPLEVAWLCVSCHKKLHLAPI